MDIKQRFEASFVVDETTGCWIWTGRRDEDEYGSFSIKSRKKRAQRVAYELYKGPIPQGLVTDHLCRVHPCVNPDHLEAVTNKENVLRGYAPSMYYRTRTACSAGHPFTPANTYQRPGYHGRGCRTCKARIKAAYLKKLRTPRPSMGNP